LREEKKYMLIINYNETGKPCPDFKILVQAEEIISNYKINKVDTVHVSTENILDALRVCVLRGHLSFDDICFVINGKTVNLDKIANYINYPNDFIDISVYLLRELRNIREEISVRTETAYNQLKKYMK
jgi:hypothetical protein